MFGKSKMHETVLTKSSMFVISFAQKMIEFVWQGERKDIVQSTVFSKEIPEGEDTLLKCQYSATVHDRGVLVEVKVDLVLHHRSRHPLDTTGNIWDWAPVKGIHFQVSSIRELRDVAVSFDVHASWRDTPTVLCGTGEQGVGNLRKVWAALGLDTNKVVSTALTEPRETTTHSA